VEGRRVSRGRRGETGGWLESWWCIREKLWHRSLGDPGARELLEIALFLGDGVEGRVDLPEDVVNVSVHGEGDGCVERCCLRGCCVQATGVSVDRIDAPDAQPGNATGRNALCCRASRGALSGGPWTARPHIGQSLSVPRRCFLLSTQLPETRLPCHPNFWNSTTDVDELDQGLVHDPMF
jgi:hypothetical protein